MICYHCMNETLDNSDYCMRCGKLIRSETRPHFLKPGTILHGHYLIGNAIGEGGYGITYVGLDQTLCLKIAIKEFFPAGLANRNNMVSDKVDLNCTKEGEYFKKARKQVLQEARSIAKFHNTPGIVNVRAYFEENNTTYIVMDFLDGLNLSDKIKQDGKIPAADAFRLFLPMMQSLGQIHSSNIIHRDISPDNIRVLPDNSLKLMDFGSARIFSSIETQTMSVQYKPGYSPYEQYSSNGNQGPWTDVYALCATIYKCITGVTPTDSLTRMNKDSLKPPSKLGVSICEPLERALIYGLEIFPENRCQSMDELIEITENALQKQQTNLHDTDRTIKGKMQIHMNAVDEQDKTHFADKTYGDKYTINTLTDPKQGGKRFALITAIICSTVVMVAVVSILTFLITQFGNKSNHTAINTSIESLIVESENGVKTNSTEKNGIIMPNVTGKTLVDATKQLNELALRVETKFNEHENVPQNCVIRQNIAAGTELNEGDTIILVISLGKASLNSQQLSENLAQNTTNNVYDVEFEVEQIRADYYATQDNPGTADVVNGIYYYTNNGKITKIICQTGTYGWDYSREYFFKNDKLYFAFIYDGTIEHRLYFVDDILIRYIDNNGVTYNYGSIQCPFEQKSRDEAYQLLK